MYQNSAPQGAHGGSGRLETPQGERPGYWAARHRLGCSSPPPLKSPMRVLSPSQARLGLSFGGVEVLLVLAMVWFLYWLSIRMKGLARRIIELHDGNIVADTRHRPARATAETPTALAPPAESGLPEPGEIPEAVTMALRSLRARRCAYSSSVSVFAISRPISRACVPRLSLSRFPIAMPTPSTSSRTCSGVKCVVCEPLPMYSNGERGQRLACGEALH